MTPLVAQPATISSYAPLPVVVSQAEDSFRSSPVDDPVPSTRSKGKRKAPN